MCVLLIFCFEYRQYTLIHFRSHRANYTNFALRLKTSTVKCASLRTHPLPLPTKLMIMRLTFWANTRGRQATLCLIMRARNSPHMTLTTTHIPTIVRKCLSPPGGTRLVIIREFFTMFVEVVVYYH